LNLFQHFPKAIAVLSSASEVNVGGKSPGSYGGSNANRIMSLNTACIVRNASPDDLGDMRQLRRNIKNLALLGTTSGHDFNQVAELALDERFADWVRR
jgi:hypothetical protein